MNCGTFLDLEDGHLDIRRTIVRDISKQLEHKLRVHVPSDAQGHPEHVWQEVVSEVLHPGIRLV